MTSEKFSLKSIFNCYRIALLKKKCNFLPCLQQCDPQQQQQQQQQQQKQQQQYLSKRLSINYKVSDNCWNIYCDPIMNEKQLKSNDFWPMYCDLTDNCRCLDCQSTYFDFNNSDYSIESDYDYNLNENVNEYFNDTFEEELIKLNGALCVDVTSILKSINLNQNSNKLHWE